MTKGWFPFSLPFQLPMLFPVEVGKERVYAVAVVLIGFRLVFDDVGEVEVEGEGVEDDGVEDG